MDANFGNSCALAGAALWATSSLLFARCRAAPFAMNLGKNVVAALAVTATLGVLAWSGGRSLVTADARALAWLVASAVVGLVLGDTFHFQALRAVGPRKALVLETLAPVLAAILGFAFVGERLGAAQLLGIAITLCGVVVVVSDRSGAASQERHLNVRGAVCGALAALGQASGAMLSKLALQRMESGPSGGANAALEASMLRLWTALAVGCGVLAFSSARRAEARHAFAFEQLRFVAPAGLLATFGGVWASLLAFQHTSVAVASTLLALSPVLVLPLTRYIGREPLSARAVVGAALSVAGIAVLFGA